MRWMNRGLIAVLAVVLATPLMAGQMKMALKNAPQGKADPHCVPGKAEPGVAASAVMSEADKLLARFVTESVAVSGSVKTALNLRVEDLKKYPVQTVPDFDMTCLNGANMGKVGGLKGALLRDLINKAVLDAPGHNDVKKMFVVATASDGYKVVFSWAELFNSSLGDGVLVYYEKNKHALGNDEGRIAMVSLRDTKTGPRHVKWLKTIEVKKFD